MRFFVPVGLCLAIGLTFATGCSDGSGPAASGCLPETVLYDVHSATCLTEPRCGDFDVRSACTAVLVPSVDAANATNRVGCAELPTEGGVARTPEDDDCDPAADSAPPNLTCMMPGSYRMAGTPQMVTLYGIVDVFGNGTDADMITVEVYAEGPDGSLVMPPIGTAVAAIASPCAETENKYDNDMIIGMRSLGFYRIDNVPTETPLIIKTSGNLGFWRPLYTYNVQIENAEVVTTAPAASACADTPTGARHQYTAKTLSRSDYNSIPLTAGIPAGITRGHGAIAGEIHDCDNVRLEFAQVGVNPIGVTQTFFSDNPSNPLPDTNRPQGTSLLGLYAALDIPPGPVDIAATGRLADGTIVSLGWYRAQIFADSVTSVTLRGLRPQQVP